MIRPIKKILGFLWVVVFIGVFCFLMLNDKKIEHIEDTNGAEDYSLQVITDENIELMDYGAKGFGSTTDNITNRTVYSSKNYSGVTEVEGYTSVGDSYTAYVNYFDVKQGNAKLVLVVDDKIVHEFKPNEAAQEFTVEGTKGAYVSIRLAGESANFKLDIN